MKNHVSLFNLFLILDKKLHLYNQVFFEFQQVLKHLKL